MATSNELRDAEFKHCDIGETQLCYQETGHGKRPLLLLHTFRTQIEHSQRIVPLLSEHFHIYLLDLPGHGRSTKSGSVVHDAPHFIASVRKFIEQMELTELTIVGESIGGTIAICLSAEIPQRLSSVFATNPYDYPASVIGGFLGNQVAFMGRFTTIVTHVGITPVLRMVLAAGFYDTTNIPKGYMRLLAMVPTADRHFAAGIKSLLKHSKSWSATADELYPKVSSDVPIHVMYGDHDWGPRSAPDVNRKRLDGNATFTTLPNTGHFAFLDNPGGVVECLNSLKP